VNFQRYVIIAELWRLKSQDVKKFLEIFASFGKTTPYGKIFKILFRKLFSSQHRSTCCVQISWNLADEKSVKSCVAYLTKKNFAWISSCRYCTDRRDHAQNLPGPAPDNVGLLRVLQISSKSVHFRRNYSRMREHRQNAPQSESIIRLKPSFEPNKNCKRHAACWDVKSQTGK